MKAPIARKLVGLYPRAWRARYEDEFVALLDARGDLTLSDAFDVLRAALRERGRSLVRLAGAEPTDLPGLRRQARLQLLGVTIVAVAIDLTAQAVSFPFPETFRSSSPGSPALLYLTFSLIAFRATWVTRSSPDNAESGIGLRECLLWLLPVFLADVLAHLSLPPSPPELRVWGWFSKPVLTLALFLNMLSMSTRSARRRVRRLREVAAAQRRSIVPTKPLDL